MSDTKQTASPPTRFIECAGDAPGKIYFDYFDEGVRILILRGPSSVNCYLGIPSKHPLAGFSYDDLLVECHGGLTFAKEGDGTLFPSEYFWYGYDYGHAGDASFYDLRPEFGLRKDDKAWTPEEIKSDSWSAVNSFRKLMRIAEAIYLKAKIQP